MNLNRILRRGLPYLIGLILVLLAVNTWFAYDNIHRMRLGRLAVSHTRDVLFALERVVSLMKDAETGERGFISSPGSAPQDRERASAAPLTVAHCAHTFLMRH